MTTAMDAAKIGKQSLPGLDCVCVCRGSFDLFYLTAHLQPGDNEYAPLERIFACVAEHELTVLRQDVFGPCSQASGGLEFIRQQCPDFNWPVTWLEGDGPSGRGVTATHVYAVRGTTPRPVHLDGQCVGFCLEDDDARYAILGNIQPGDPSLSRRDQTLQALERSKQTLAEVKMDFSHVVRTWMYIDNILDWYDDFNEVRNGFFADHKIFDGLVPASTGVGVGNPAGTALVVNILAVHPKSGNASAARALSPLQCPAPEYGSSFSRAIEVTLPDHRTLYVSGTASIEPGGETVHLDDVPGQIDLSMKVVHAILESRNMSWQDISRGDAYFKDMKDAPLFEQYCRDHNIPPLPIALAHAAICRDNLLFEIEVDAVKA